MFRLQYPTPSPRPTTSAPIASPRRSRPAAQFVQSQYCFDVPMFREYMKKVRDLGLHEKCYILVGVGPMASAKTAKWIRSNVPGIHIPDAVIKRLEGAEDQKKEGKQLCIDIINEVKEIEGVSAFTSWPTARKNMSRKWCMIPAC